MNTLPVVLMCSLSLSLPLKADSELNQQISSLCTLVASDNGAELKQKIGLMHRQLSIPFSRVYRATLCRDLSMLRLAMRLDAQHSAKILLDYLPDELLHSPEYDTRTLTEWAEEQQLATGDVYAMLDARLRPKGHKAVK